MNTYIVNIYWRYSSENFEYGLVKADSPEEAKKKIKLLNPNCIGVDVWEIVFDSDDYCTVYSH